MRNKNVNFKIFRKKEIGFGFSYSDIHDLAIQKWGHDIGGKNPSYFPKPEDSLLIFRGEGNKHPHFSDCINTLKECELFLPNVHGLVLLEMMDREFALLEPESWTLGFDNLHNLNLESGLGHFVPCLMKEDVGIYQYTWFSRNSKLEHDEFVLGYRRKEDE